MNDRSLVKNSGLWLPSEMIFETTITFYNDYLRNNHTNEKVSLLIVYQSTLKILSIKKDECFI